MQRTLPSSPRSGLRKHACFSAVCLRISWRPSARSQNSGYGVHHLGFVVFSVVFSAPLSPPCPPSSSSASSFSSFSSPSFSSSLFPSSSFPSSSFPFFPVLCPLYLFSYLLFSLSLASVAQLLLLALPVFPGRLRATIRVAWGLPLLSVGYLDRWALSSSSVRCCLLLGSISMLLEKEPGASQELCGSWICAESKTCKQLMTD